MSNIIKQDRTIYVTIKNVYGNELIYPACDDSRVFAELIGQKTLTTQDLRKIRSLGYEVEVKPQTLAIAG